MTHRSLVLALVSLAFAQIATAHAQQQQQSQPDWPCRQVRVPELAVASVWTGPPLDEPMKHWREDQTLADLVVRVSERRTPMDEAEQLVAQFANAAGDRRKERLTMLFAGVYERMNDERRDVVNGLDRFGRRLKDMAEKAREETQTLRDLQDRSRQTPKRSKRRAKRCNGVFGPLRSSGAWLAMCAKARR